MDLTLSRRSVLAGTAGVAALAATGVPLPAAAAAPGAPAPDFTGTDMSGKTVRLADMKGKVVVLEWTNHDCPFVKKHYGAGNMQALQKEYTAKGVQWVTIVSSAPGEQGHVSAEQAKEIATKAGAAPTFKLLDPQGVIGRAYDAKVTPHMYVIGADGTLLYNGAIDDKPTANQSDIPGARSYVREALDAALAGQPVPTATSKAYGCTIKYAKNAA